MTNVEELIEQSNQQELSRFKESLNRYAKKWPWLLMCVVFALIVAFLYLKLTPNRYNVTSKIQINKTQSLVNPTDLLFGGRSVDRFKGLIDERIIFNSFPLIQKTVEALNFDVTYLKETRLNTIEIYKNVPFTIEFNRDSFRNNSENVELNLKLLNAKEFNIESEMPFRGENLNGKFSFGQTITLGDFKFKILKSSNFINTADFESKYVIKVNSLFYQTYAYKNKIEFEEAENYSSILSLTMKSTVPEKSIDFINTLIENYIELDLETKNQVAKNTVEFIDKQLASISDSLTLKEKNLENFKSSESIGSLSLKGEMLIQKYNEIESEKAHYEVIQQYYDYLQETLESGEGQKIENIIAPSAYGIQDEIVSGLVQSLIELNLSKKAIEEEGSTKNPIYRQIELRIKEIVRTLNESVRDLSKANQIVLNDLNKRSNRITNSAQKLPVNERKLVNLNRLLQLNENIYLFLMEKRSTAAIQMSSATPDCKVIEPAMIAPLNPVSPNKKVVFLIAIVLALFIPSAIIIVADFMNDTVQSKDDVELATSVPLIGTLPRAKNDKKLYVAIEQSKSALAESFRLVRANLSFFQKKQFPFVIMLTSTVAKEGKTFCAINLASILAATGKKTVLLGFDLRKPQLQNYLNLENGKGLSNFLSSDISVEEIVKPTKQENLSVILSGAVPPNPSELLINEKTKDLFHDLRQRFHYIVVDTPPVGLVADARILSQESDLNIFVIRQGFSKRNFINNINDLVNSEKLKNLSIIINDVEKSEGYNSGYYEMESSSGKSSRFNFFKKS